MNDALSTRVLNLVAATFDVPLEEVTVKSSPETLPEWNSLGQLNLLLALEQEFGLQVAPEQAYELVSVDAIIRFLRTTAAGNASSST